MRRFNWKLIAQVTGVLLLYLAAGLLLPLVLSIYEHDGMQFAFAVSGMLILMAGLFLRNMVGGKAEYRLRQDESYWLTVAAWVVMPLFGALPYLFTGVTQSFTDALFESFSGFTTTGSSVIRHPEELPPSILAYRALTQWVGGLGLLLFVVALLRRLGLGAGSLYEAEFSGTQQRKLHPRLAQSVTRMWTIYGLLTATLWGLLMVQGVGLVDAFCTACSTVSTGGFTTHSEGITALGVHPTSTVTVFMFFSGVNVAILYRLFTLRWRHLWHDGELRTYTLLFVCSVALCTTAFFLEGNGFSDSLHFSIFHIASTMSTCGYHMPVPTHWSFVVSVLTFVLIVIGASAGSTGGGIKLRRIIIMVKYIANYLTRMIHPNVVFHVKVNNEVVESDYINKVFAFVFLYIVFIIGGGFVLTMCGCSIPNSVCMAAANISNLGPSPLINTMGGSLDYAVLPHVAKWTLTLLMLAGRVELFALLAVVSPAYWRLRLPKTRRG